MVLRNLGLRRGLPLGLLSATREQIKIQTKNEINFQITELVDGRLGEPVVIDAVVRDVSAGSIALGSGLDSVTASAPLAHRGKRLLAKDEHQDDAGRQEQVEEKRLAVQSLVHFDNVDGLVENRLAKDPVVLLKLQKRIRQIQKKIDTILDQDLWAVQLSLKGCFQFRILDTLKGLIS